MTDKQNTEIDFTSFFEKTPDLVWIAGTDGYLKKVNKAVVDKLGYSEEELYASPVEVFMYEEDRIRTLEKRSRLLSGELMQNFSNRYVTKSGEVVWFEWTSIYFAEQETVLAIAKDISARKKIEQEVEERYNRVKKMATHFKTSHEKDKKVIAYELHEDLAQLAAVVHMDIAWLNKNTGNISDQVQLRLDHAAGVAKLLIKTLQRLSFSISPRMLDDFGLNTTLEWLCNEFSILNSIKCSYECVFDELGLNEETKIDFFRICQDTLNNVINLPTAGEIIVRIEDIDDVLQISILDNRNGFGGDDDRRESGLIGIRERVSSLNGKLKICKQDKTGNVGILIRIKKACTTSLTLQN